jgi:hypothetical protein
MIKVGRFINGISINDKEWLLTNDGEIMFFQNKEKAIEFLKENGFDELSTIEIEESFSFEKIKS